MVAPGVCPARFLQDPSLHADSCGFAGAGGVRDTAGTLKDYRKKHTDLDIEKAINGWGRSILSGLAFLHAQTPPIVHRDLRCVNKLAHSTSSTLLGSKQCWGPAVPPTRLCSDSDDARPDVAV